MERSTGKSKKLEWYFLVPVILMAAIVPLVVHLKEVPVENSIFPFWTGEQTSNDINDYYKSVVIVLSGILSMFTLLVIYVMDRLPARKYVILCPVGMYLLTIVLSSVLSDYKYVSLYGFIERYEGMFALLSYLAVFILVLYMPLSTANLKLFATAVMVSALSISLIGIMEFYNFNFFTDTTIGKLLLLPSRYHSNLSDINIQWKAFDNDLAKNTISTTFGNSNYAGSYFAMVFPFFCLQSFFARNKPYRVCCMVASLILFFCLLGSNSRAGYLSLAVTGLMLLFFTVKNLKGIRKQLLIMVFAFMSIFTLVNLTADGSIYNRLFSMLKGVEPQTAVNIDKIKDYQANKDELIIKCTHSSLKIRTEGSRLAFYDNNDEPLDIDENSVTGKIKFRNSKYSGLIVEISGDILTVNKGNSSLRFRLASGSYKLLDKNGGDAQIKAAESIGFKGKERFASSRGYIWSRTLPLLKNTLLVGFGPDTYAMYFPQNDYIGKLNHMYDAYIIVDKPHNMYLQTAVNTGLLSLAALFVLFAMYIYQSVILFRRLDFKDEHTVFAAAFFLAVTGYLVTGLFNDSVVSVAPVFWVMLGMGFNVNVRLVDKYSQNPFADNFHLTHFT